MEHNNWAHEQWIQINFGWCQKMSKYFTQTFKKLNQIKI